MLLEVTFQNFEFKCPLNQEGYSPKQRFPSVGDHILDTPTFKHASTTPKHAVIGDS